MTLVDFSGIKLATSMNVQFMFDISYTRFLIE